MKDRRDERLDEQKGYKEEQKRRHGESDAHGKENRRNQESQVRKERSKEALGHQGRGEGGEAKREKKVSSVKKAEEDVLFLDEKQNASHWSKQHPDDWTKAEKRKHRSKKEEGEVEKNNIYIYILKDFKCLSEENHPLSYLSPPDENQPCKCSFDIMKNPILIAVIVVGCMIIGVVIVMLVV